MFHKDGIYRRSALHDEYGGSRQAGISPCRKAPLVLLFSGLDSPEKHDYEDRWLPDGSFQYCGEGQTNDQVFLRGNKAIRDHVEDRRDLFLFSSTTKGFVRCIGQFVYHSYREERIEIEDGSMRNTIYFKLLPIDSFSPSEPPSEFTSFIAAEPSAYRSEGNTEDFSKERHILVLKKYRERKEWVKQYALQRAQGVCEACDRPAPFKKKDGTPFLEVHHIHKLADGGPDLPDFVAAICPNCHRHSHHGHDQQDFNTKLKDKVDRIEANLRKMEGQ